MDDGGVLIPVLTDEEVARLLEVLPPRIADAARGRVHQLVEIALDVGRPPVARYLDGHGELAPEPVTRDELSSVIVATAGTYTRTNRAGIAGTLHRVSLIRDSRADPVGLTIRVGRHIPGVAGPLRRLAEDAGSVLIVGPPGSGKTSVLRDIVSGLAERLGPAVLVVDSNNEIGGDGAVPHPAIGRARRMQVPEPGSPMPADQHLVMIEAVRNHFPDVIVVDEISTGKDVEAAMTIARRGVRLIATAHGEGLSDVAGNPDLCPLLGIAAPSSRRRASPPVFRAAAHLRRDRTAAVYADLAAAVDALLEGRPPEAGIVRMPAVSLAPPPPRRERVSALIPESDPWAWTAVPGPHHAPHRR
jgi:stage III sporulation protein SpoIIIAA